MYVALEELMEGAVTGEGIVGDRVVQVVATL